MKYVPTRGDLENCKKMQNAKGGPRTFWFDKGGEWGADEFFMLSWGHGVLELFLVGAVPLQPAMGSLNQPICQYISLWRL